MLRRIHAVWRILAILGLLLSGTTAVTAQDTALSTALCSNLDDCSQVYTSPDRAWRPDGRRGTKRHLYQP